MLLGDARRNCTCSPDRLRAQKSVNLLLSLGDTISKIRNYSTNYPRAEFDETTCSPFPPSPEPFRKA